MGFYPTDDNFKDEREETLDSTVRVWVNAGDTCPDCGNGVLTRIEEYNDVVEVEIKCDICGFYDVYYE
jgi:hypothetical protein